MPNITFVTSKRENFNANKFTNINIVDFFITRSITSNKFALSSLNQEIRLLATFSFDNIIFPQPARHNNSPAFQRGVPVGTGLLISN